VIRAARGFGIGMIVLLLAATLVRGSSDEPPLFSDSQLGRIVQQGPWPPPLPVDPSNRVSGSPPAIAFGERLFFEPRLSADGKTSCATCHIPERGWTDGRPRGLGAVELDRNTPGLWNVGLQRWFGWDGASDSLWSQSIRPIVDPREMQATPAHVAALLRSDPALACGYDVAFGPKALAKATDEAILVATGKAIAAFLETLASGRTPFDDFRDALVRGAAAAAARYPAKAQRGLQIFVGSGRCYACHFGPAFTNGEFHDVGVPFFIAPGRVDPGRHAGIGRLRANPFNLLGAYSDDTSGRAATKTRHLEVQHRNWGEFKVPALRNVALTAPYMHDGRFATLRDVVKHYSEIDEERLHSDGEKIVRPLRLSAEDVDDLVAFLQTLTSSGPAYARRAPPACP
jgi:cytochrome c peroxidase